MRRLLQYLLLACCLSLQGCQTPTRTAQALRGRWEGGATTLIFTANGLYGLSLPGRRPSAGYYGIPRPNQILVSQVVGAYQLRNLWKIEHLDGDHLTIIFPNQQKAQLKRSQASPPDDPLIAGLWLSSTPGRSILEITPDGDYINLSWSAQRRRISVGQVRSEKNRIRFMGGVSGESNYIVTKGQLSLEANPPSQDSTTYSRVSDPGDLFRQR